MVRREPPAQGAHADVPLPVLAAAPGAGQRARFGSGRGRWRALVLAGVTLFMVLHAVQWLAMGTTLAPIEPSESMQTVKDGVVTVGAVFFALALASTALLGRWFCGWGCHWVAIQDATAWWLARRGLRPRPFRSRLLAWMPLALGLYMFAWPAVYRLAVAPFVQPDLRWPGFSAHFVTGAFWSTFPGLAVGVPFVLVSGVLVVWLLGTKGYCTYACPYGGLFAPAEELAPMRIVVDHDRCHQCGACTAACTSNVRVHEEVRDFGQVVDPGCMKCMDCVSACPNDALRFGVGTPAIAVDRTGRRATEAAARRWDLSWPEEISLAALGVAALLAVRGSIAGLPLLFASGVAACTVFVAWKAWRTLRAENESFHGVRLRFRGRLGAAGAAWIAAAALLLSAVAWVGTLNGAAWLAERADARVDVPAEAVFTEQGMDPVRAVRADADRALALYRIASAMPEGWSFVPASWRAVDLRRAYLLSVNRDFAAAELVMRRSWERDGPDESAAAMIGRILRSSAPRRDEALRWYDETLAVHPAWRRLREEQVTWLDQLGEFPRMIASARAGLEAIPGDLQSMRRLSLALVERGATPAELDEGIRLVRETLRIDPSNGFAHAALARGLLRQGDRAGAEAAFRRALELEPGSATIRSMAVEAGVVPPPAVPAR